MEKIKPFLVGPAVGITQTIIGHPLDTLKTLKQNDIPIDFKKINIKRMYYGVKYPMGLHIVFNSVAFTTFEMINNKINNEFVSGATAGMISGVIINPFDIYKINRQMGDINTSSYKLFRGLPITLVREGLSTGIYFHSYFTLKKLGLNTLMSGGLAGCLSWFVTYPIDTIKTKYQSLNINYNYNNHNMASNNNISIINFTKKTINESGGFTLRNKLFNGLGLCMARAFIVNSVSFMIYDLVNDN